MSEPRVSTDPNKNLKNDAIWFPRLIAELEAAGALDTDMMRQVALSMDCTLDEVTELVDRARVTWDALKAKMAAPS